jgi:hypothetical protein
MVSLRLWCAATSCLLAAPAVGAQELGRWDIAATVMHSPTASAPGPVFGGLATGIRQSALGLRASTTLVRVGPVALRYSASLLPIIRLGHVEGYSRLATDSSSIYVIGTPTTAWGVGVAPLGLDLSVHPSRRTRLDFGAAAGIAWFSQNVPVAASRQRAFTAEWRTGLSVDAGRGRTVEAGVLWKHTSNGLTAWENPGVDNRLIYAGIGWRVRALR